MIRIVLGVLCAASLAGSAAAEVVGKSPAGFQTRVVTEIAAPPAKVWAALGQMPRWWSPSHTYSGKAENLSFKAESGACFCERLPGGGSVLHATVVMAMPEQTLRLSGGLGPLQGEAAAATWTFVLKSSATGTTLTQTMAIGGWSPNGLDALAAPVDGVLSQQQARLKRFVETGKP
jgi:uncharacterized protein YndB with AHSA1/START domain